MTPDPIFAPTAALRALLLVQGDEELAAALRSGADAVLIGHATDGTSAWRDLVRTALGESAGSPSLPDIYAAVDLDDLDASLRLASVLTLLRGVILGSAQTTKIEQLSARLAVAEAHNGLEDGALRILAKVADARSVLAIAGAPSVEPRLAGLIFDAADLAHAMGVQSDAEPVRTARGLSVVAAMAGGLPAIAGPDHSTGAETVRRAARRAKADGFFTQTAVTPEQLHIISEVFGHAERRPRKLRSG